MKYLGGKSRTARQIAGYLNTIRRPDQVYWEPFVGAGWVLVRIPDSPRYASDANHYLIQMWKALQNGWKPPSHVSESEYAHIRDHKDDYPPELVAFVGFSASFGGKWFAGYARGTPGKKMLDRADSRNYVIEGRRSLLLKRPKILDVAFVTADFFTVGPPAPNCLIYCDPPYENTTAYGALPDFDTPLFWNRVRALSLLGHTVITSEYQAPSDFTCLLEMSTTTDLNSQDGVKLPRTERLFRYGHHPPLQLSLL